MRTSQLVLLSGGWHPRRLFLGSELGTIQNPSNISSVYQDNANATPGAVGSAVSVLLDERYLLARSGNVVTNGDFGSATGWTLNGAGLAITGGQLEATAVANGADIRRPALTSGKWYLVGYTVASISGSVRLLNVVKTGAIRTTPGAYSEFLYAENASIGLQFLGASSTAVIDDFYAYEVYGSHALQATADNRPLLAAGGKVDYDGVNDALVTTWASSLGAACTVGRSVPQGEATILTGQTIATTYSDNTDHCGVVIINRDLTASETNKLRRWLNRRAG
jgi:hypothetical protein